MTIYYMDEEFIDDGKAIDLISIGIVAEDGKELYLQSCEFQAQMASEWVWQNVYPHLKRCNQPYGEQKSILDELNIHKEGLCIDYRCPWRSRERMRGEIQAFLDPAQYGTPEFYGWCASYDFVAFCQLWGTMMDLPEGYPHYIRDLQYTLDLYHITDDMLPQQEQGLHNALSDARHIKRLWEAISSGKIQRIYSNKLIKYEE